MTCPRCAANGGMYSMSCAGCILRLIRAEPMRRRKETALRSLKAAPPEVADEVRRTLSLEISLDRDAR